MDRHATGKATSRKARRARDAERRASRSPYSFKTRFEDESGKSGTNPEELIAAAHAGCYAMQFSHFLAEEWHAGDETRRQGVVVTLIPATGHHRQRAGLWSARCPASTRQSLGEIPPRRRRRNVRVSKALGAIKVSLDARLA